jgi:DNA-directed RNA polymerase subunit M/transcription elongation factor TFIIS
MQEIKLFNLLLWEPGQTSIVPDDISKNIYKYVTWNAFYKSLLNYEKFGKLTLKEQNAIMREIIESYWTSMINKAKQLDIIYISSLSLEDDLSSDFTSLISYRCQEIASALDIREKSSDVKFIEKVVNLAEKKESNELCDLLSSDVINFNFNTAKIANEIKDSVIHKYVAVGTRSDQYPCPNCGKRCVNIQKAQNRSADEAIGDDLECEICHHTWIV